MAISENRFNADTVLNSAKTDFISPTDKTKDTASNKEVALAKTVKSTLNKKAVKEGKDSFLSESLSSADSLANKLGIFKGEIKLGCSGGINLDSDNSPDSRGLVKTNNSGCDDSLDGIMDSIFKSTIVVDKYLNKIDDKSLANIEKMAGVEVANLVKKTKLTKDSIDVNSMVSNIVGKAGNIGGSLNIKNAISKIGGLCNSKSSNYSFGDLSFFKDFLISLSLNIGDCLSPDKLLGLVGDLIKSGIGTPGDIVKGFINNFNTAEDPKVADKVSLLSSIIKNSTEDLSIKDLLKTKDSTSSIVKALSSSKNKSTGLATDYNLTVDALDSLDYNWVSSTSEVDNYSEVKNNSYLNKLSGASLVSSVPNDTALNGTATLGPTKKRALGIKAANLYSKDKDYIKQLRVRTS